MIVSHGVGDTIDIDVGGEFISLQNLDHIPPT